jgi:hypothetical protein
VVDLDNPPPAPVNEGRANALRELYERGPLYRKYTYAEQRNAIGVVVNTIRYYCPVCHQEQPFDQIRARSHGFGCRVCRDYSVQFYLQFGEADGVNWAMKVGEYPAPAERLPKELETRLSVGDLDFYRKAIRARTFGFGLASLAYLRRVVENRTNELLDLIVEAAAQQGDTDDVVRRVTEAKAGYQFDQKVELAGQILPRSLRPGGMNPLDALHDLASAGIHRMSEEECLDLFDKARTGFEFLFRQLQIDRDAAREYVDVMNKLQQAREHATQMRSVPDEAPSMPKKDAANGESAV